MPIETKQLRLRWSDLDPNFHLRHSSFYDLASQYRMEVLDDYGLTMTIMEEQKFAPILLREECVFLREIRYKDIVSLNFLIEEMSEDASKWQIAHEFKDDKGKLKAKLTVNIAWFDIQKRRLAKPLPQAVIDFKCKLLEGE